jgi:hypothetical protein
MAAQAICERLRAAAWNGLADGMSRDGHQHAEPATQGLIKAEKRMRCKACEQRPSSCAAETAGHYFRGDKSADPEARH